MKKIKPETVLFQPIIQVHDTGDSWAISFDSGSDRDAKRAPRTVFVTKTGIKHLQVDVDGFNVISDALTIPGRIQLEVEYADASNASTYLLAECDLSSWAQHRQLTAEAPVHDVLKSVRNGTADAFTAVLLGLFATRSSGGQHHGNNVVDALPRQAVGTLHGGSRSWQRAQASRLQRWKPGFAVGGVVIAVWVLLSIFSRHAPSTQDALASSAAGANSPDAAVLLQNQLQPPSGPDAQAQVQVVKDTLKSMGLDPGASGDTGCLVQPH